MQGDHFWGERRRSERPRPPALPPRQGSLLGRHSPERQHVPNQGQVNTKALDITEKTPLCT